jgi:hypothetical protein
MRLFASAAKISVLIIRPIAVVCGGSLSFKLKVLLKAFKFWFTALLLAWLTNQFDQVVGRRGTNQAQSPPDLDWYLDVLAETHH